MGTVLFSGALKIMIILLFKEGSLRYEADKGCLKAVFTALTSSLFKIYSDQITISLFILH